jgi:CRP-like cAMP-binding protein
MLDKSYQLGIHKLIFKEGAEAEFIYLVEQGEVICLKLVKDRLLPVNVARQGDIIGESAMVDIPYNYTAITRTNVVLAKIPKSKFKEVLSFAPKWLTDLTKTLIQRFSTTSELIVGNKVLHQLIVPEEDYSSREEIEYKKLLKD